MNNTKNLFDLGSLMSLRIGYWSGRKMVTKSDLIQMGLNPERLPADLVNYGRKLLVSKSEIRAFSRIDQKARSYLANYGVPFNAVSAYFVPGKQLKTVEATLEGYKKEFFENVDSFIKRFEDIKKEVEEKYPEFYEKCLKRFFPASPELLRNKFTFQWFVFKIAGLDSLEETTVDKAIEENSIIEERKNLLRQKMQEEVGGFVKEYVTQMREETVKFCELMKARIEGKPYGDEAEAKQLTGRSIGFFRKHIEKFQQMNIFGDSEVAKMLEEFKNAYLDYGATVKSFESPNIKHSVSKALSVIRDAAAVENEKTSEFINSVKRKIVI